MERDSVNAKALVEELLRLDDSGLARVLCAFAWELTIVGRESYVPGSLLISAPAQLRAVNECQHLVLGIATRLLTSQQLDRESLGDALIERLSDVEIGVQARRALRRGISRVNS